MQKELGFKTLRIVETKDHVNIKCLKDCLHYVVYTPKLEYKRTIFAGHSVKAHLEYWNMQSHESPEDDLTDSSKQTKAETTKVLKKTMKKAPKKTLKKDKNKGMEKKTPLLAD